MCEQLETSCVAANMVDIGTHEMKERKDISENRGSIIPQDSETAQISIPEVRLP